MKVLIVDDTEDVRALLRMALSIAGIESVEANEGPTALEMLADGVHPDLVLLDVQMPVMDGWHVLTAIREAPNTSDLPVIMCTVKSRPEDMLKGWELGCDGYLSKPFDIDSLVATIRSVVARAPRERLIAREDQRAHLREVLAG
jgi:DNA-binding response OmpR family regulator